MAFSFVPSAESRDLADDIQELFADLASTLKHEHRAFTGECTPAVDVRETAETLEIVVDVPGVPAQAIRVLFRSDVLLVAVTGWGQPEDRRRTREAGFDHHLVKPPELGSVRDICASVHRADAKKTAAS